MQKQKGFAHGIIIIIATLLLVAALSFVFCNSFLKKNMLGSEKTITYKTFTSVSGSGLTFTYPDSWTFNPPSKVTDFRPDSKTISYLLFSQPMHVAENSRPEVSSDSMCVTFSEFKGNFPFKSTLSEGYGSIKDIMVGPNRVSLMTGEGDIAATSMHLASSDPISEHGAYYVALNDGYYLVASAQKNCFPSEHPLKRDIDQDFKEARTILESVHLAE